MRHKERTAGRRASPGPAPAERGIESPGQETQPARILVVDDEPVICDILRDFLEFEGFFVRTAGNGAAALDEIRKDRFDLVLTDLKMPEVDGIELLHRIHDLERDIMAVIMTGFGTVETAIEAMKKGAFDYILKPFKPEEVARVLRRALDQQALQRENVALRETLGFYELSEALASSMPLNDQLNMIVEMVRDNFGADCVSLIVEDPKKPGTYVPRALCGRDGMSPRVTKLVETFLADKNVLAHGDSVHEWIENPAHAEYDVQSYMAAPLKIRGAPFGIISAFS
ncbi:MAG: response regulator, partial [Deltaproteobacteria bacterium]|nr:response regulator [Deltaproteobacteria bacterium]